MSKEKDQDQKQPYMYIVQPEISPPESNMQDQYRAVIEETEHTEKSDEGLHQNSTDEIVIVSSEKVKTTPFASEISIYDEQQSMEDSKEVVEVSTGVQLDQKDEKGKKRPPRRKTNKKQKFNEMSKEELVTYLARMPAAVPKPTCFMVIKGKRVRGQVQRKRGEDFFVKVLVGDRDDTMIVKMDDIEEIKVENL
ncbi:MULTISPECIES: CotO family spore coat protein [Bacillus]|uniref:CotO family spore coat protein n=1 Tax=Bacillus TaxID=1386 RepID=UPI0003036065|nr:MULTISPECIES: CotO family spore coat protein [Bacillus]